MNKGYMDKEYMDKEYMDKEYMDKEYMDKEYMGKEYMDKEYMNELTWLKSKSVSAPPSLRTGMFMWIPGSSNRTCTL